MVKELLKAVVFLEVSLYWGFAKPLKLDSSAVTETVPVDLKIILPVIIAGVVLIAFIGVLIGCVCCPGHGLKSYEHQNGVTRHHLNTSNYTRQSDTPIVDSEFAIFPPPSILVDQSVRLLDKHEVSFEPLPEIRPRRQDKDVSSSRYPLRPAFFTYGAKRNFSIRDWFVDEPHKHFPRNQLQYLQEVGFGWFGQVVEGEAHNINPCERKSKVIVKILREDASLSELASFLHEVQLYRDLKHPNILRLLNQCLESNPFLLIMEHCTQDMKQFLIEHCNDSELLIKGGQILSMMCDVAVAMNFMHKHGFISRDLAARNCFVTSGLTVKLGDYGTSIQKYKDDYYFLGDIALPVRWCAPESVFCTKTTIETKQLSKEANVWSFGVLLWEILEFGKQPYSELTNDEVLELVLSQQTVKLEKPQTPCSHAERLYEVMKSCWETFYQRPLIEKVAVLLKHLYESRDIPAESVTFEDQQNTLQPIFNYDNTTSHFKTHGQFESDFTVYHSLEEIPSSQGSFSTSYEVGFEPKTHISPSLQNQKGSLEDLSLLKEKHCESSEGLKYSSVKTKHLKSLEKSSEQGITDQQITDAIKDLDTILANEVSSSSAETSKRTSPDRSRQEIAEFLEHGSDSQIPSALYKEEGHQDDSQIPAALYKEEGHQDDFPIPASLYEEEGHQDDSQIPASLYEEEGHQDDSQIPAALYEEEGHQDDSQIPASLYEEEGHQHDSQIPAALHKEEGHQDDSHIPADLYKEEGHQDDSQIPLALYKEQRHQDDFQIPSALYKEKGHQDDSQIPAALYKEEGHQDDSRIPSAVYKEEGHQDDSQIPSADLYKEEGHQDDSQIPLALYKEQRHQDGFQIPSALYKEKGHQDDSQIPAALYKEEGHQDDSRIPSAEEGHQDDSQIQASLYEEEGHQDDSQIPAALYKEEGHQDDSQIPTALTFPQVRGNPLSNQNFSELNEQAVCLIHIAGDQQVSRNEHLGDINNLQKKTSVTENPSSEIDEDTLERKWSSSITLKSTNILSGNDNTDEEPMSVAGVSTSYSCCASQTLTYPVLTSSVSSSLSPSDPAGGTVACSPSAVAKTSNLDCLPKINQDQRFSFIPKDSDLTSSGTEVNSHFDSLCNSKFIYNDSNSFCVLNSRLTISGSREYPEGNDCNLGSYYDTKTGNISKAEEIRCNEPPEVIGDNTVFIDISSGFSTEATNISVHPLNQSDRSVCGVTATNNVYQDIQTTDEENTQCYTCDDIVDHNEIFISQLKEDKTIDNQETTMAGTENLVFNPVLDDVGLNRNEYLSGFQIQISKGSKNTNFCSNKIESKNIHNPYENDRNFFCVNSSSSNYSHSECIVSQANKNSFPNYFTRSQTEESTSPCKCFTLEAEGNETLVSNEEFKICQNSPHLTCTLSSDDSPENVATDNDVKNNGHSSVYRDITNMCHVQFLNKSEDNLFELELSSEQNISEENLAASVAEIEGQLLTIPANDVMKNGRDLLSSHDGFITLTKLVKDSYSLEKTKTSVEDLQPVTGDSVLIEPETKQLIKETRLNKSCEYVNQRSPRLITNNLDEVGRCDLSNLTSAVLKVSPAIYGPKVEKKEVPVIVEKTDSGNEELDVNTLTEDKVLKKDEDIESHDYKPKPDSGNEKLNVNTLTEDKVLKKDEDKTTLQT
ncbi:uncharacterized protein LOC143236557 [Tachypleus tridentatus]|uniref:uncharacterized protein LOC143236557 n=1 Tax=Tachypleus tridentatus TaxID=6853 RepID=UPI003FCF0055